MKRILIITSLILVVVIGFVGCEILGLTAEEIVVSEMITDAFPTVTGGLEIRNLYDGYYTGLDEDDFPSTVTENIYSGTSAGGELLGTATFPLEVEINMSEGTSKVDVVFVFDTTGSMYGEIDGMVDGANAFADLLEDSGVNYRIGCVTFGDTYGNTGEADGEEYDGYDEEYKEQYRRKYLAPVSDVEDFKDFMDSLEAFGGGDGNENFIDAIDYARTGIFSSTNPEGSFQGQALFSYRLGAKKVFVGITDISYQTPSSSGDVDYYYDAGGPYNSSVYNTIEDEIAALEDDNIVMHVVSPLYYKADYTKLAYDTGGVWIDMDSDFSSVISTVGSSISSNYIIRFTTTDETLDTFRRITFDLAGQNVIIEYAITASGRSSESIRVVPSSDNYAN